METVCRDIVIEALNKATGILNEPEMARRILGGGDVRFDEMEIDSLSLFEVIMEVEERLGIELDADLVAAQPSIDAFAGYLAART